MPDGLQLDGELVTFDSEGRPSFDLLCRRMLARDSSVPVCLLVFDVLAVDGAPTLAQPYSERRANLEALDAPAVLGDGAGVRHAAALWAVVTEQRLEGVVAKRLCDPYLPGDRRRWVKTKSPAWLQREPRARSDGERPASGGGWCQRPARDRRNRSSLDSTTDDGQPLPLAHFSGLCFAAATGHAFLNLPASARRRRPAEHQTPVLKRTARCSVIGFRRSAS